MRVLAITKIFPNSREPLSAPFNRQQFAELAKLCELTVLAAIPYVPLAGVTRVPARAGKLASLPASERVAGIETHYLRQLYVPKVGLSVAVPLYLASLGPYRRLVRGADVVFATWAYPDGCAAVLFAHVLSKPCVVKVHGTDVNDVLQRAAVRAVASRILPRAEAMVAVSNPLAEELGRLGVLRERIHLVRNGVDAGLFSPRDRGEARRALELPQGGPLILFVGRIEPAKGAPELVEAFAQVRAARPDAMLALVGDGAWAERARSEGRAFGPSFLLPGVRPLPEIARWMAACDVFVLPSHAEGTPNVVLEALASGRPVVATRVGGIPDVLADPRAGLLVPPKDSRALAEALLAALSRSWDAAEVHSCGPTSWDESARSLYRVLQGVAS
jgi:teichuronic acid biosynthesis glycosyltransferase TuaC